MDSTSVCHEIYNYVMRPNDLSPSRFMHISTDNISQTVTDIANVAIAKKYKVAYDLPISMCISDVGRF